MRFNRFYRPELTAVVIEELSTKEALFRMGLPVALVAHEPDHELHVVMPAIRKERLAFAVEKLSELGVNELHLVTTDLSQPRSYKIDRLHKIAIEAAEQSGRHTVLRISEEGKVDDFVESTTGTFLVCSVTSQHPVSKDIHDMPEPLYVCLGPEGGWSEREEQMFRDTKTPTLSLGGLVLRTETAAIVACSRLLL